MRSLVERKAIGQTRGGEVKYICLILGCNHKVCTETKWFGDDLFQGFKCSRCGTPSTYWGHVINMRDCNAMINPEGTK